jgi:tRNA-binding protein
MISIEDFNKLDLRLGTVLSAQWNRKSRVPAYAISIDFGEKRGVLKSSAQITDLYSPEDLIGRQVVCCVNLKPLYVGLVKSAARVLAAETPRGFVWVRPDGPAENGEKTR